MSFAMNREYIASHLCEERDRPDNTCKGCCQLRKRLDGKNQKNAGIPEGFSKEQNELLATLGEYHSLPAVGSGSVSRFPAIPVFIPDPPNRTIDHPPQFSQTS